MMVMTGLSPDLNVGRQREAIELCRRLVVIQKQRPFLFDIGRLPARIAKVSLRYRQIAIKPTYPHTDKEPISLWVVHIREQKPPRTAARVEWSLLTTLRVESTEDALNCVINWYKLRWRIEDWHRVLKSGCGVEKLLHKTAERLQRAIAINAVIAWRIMLMTLLGRETPSLPVEILFSDLEIKVLNAYAQKKTLTFLTR